MTTKANSEPKKKRTPRDWRARLWEALQAAKGVRLSADEGRMFLGMIRGTEFADALLGAYNAEAATKKVQVPRGVLALWDDLTPEERKGYLEG